MASLVFEHWLFSANSHLATPDASRATTPVEDIEMFDPSCPSLSPDDSILLPIGKVAGYLDVTLKALTLHTEARTSFITYASSPYWSSHPINLTEYKRFLLFVARVFFLFKSISFNSPPSPLP